MASRRQAERKSGLPRPFGPDQQDPALADPDRSRVKEERFLPQREHSQKKIVRKDAAPPRHGPKAADIVSEGEQRIRVVTEREVLPLRVRRIVCAQRNRRR